MANPALAYGSLQKWNIPSAHETKEEKRIRAAAVWADVCRRVSLREGHRCRVCDRKGATHHHHVVYRSRGGADTVENVCLLCKSCHDEEHVKRTLSIEGDADTGLALWRRNEDQTWYLWRQETAPRVYVGAL